MEEFLQFRSDEKYDPWQLHFGWMLSEHQLAVKKRAGMLVGDGNDMRHWHARIFGMVMKSKLCGEQIYLMLAQPK